MNAPEGIALSAMEASRLTSAIYDEDVAYIRADIHAAALDREAALREALKMISQESKEDNSVLGRSVFKALETCGEIADLALAGTETEGRG